MKGIGVVGEELSQTSESIWKIEHYDLLPFRITSTAFLQGKTPWHSNLKLLQGRLILLTTASFVIHLIALTREQQGRAPLLFVPYKELPDIVSFPIHIMGRQMP